MTRIHLRLSAAALLTLAACQDGGASSAASADSTTVAAADSVPRDTAPSTPPPPADTAPRASSSAADANLTGTVTKQGDRRFSIDGRTRGATTLQLTVEDGHDVLYGPVDVPVTGGGFRAEVTLEPTQRRTVYAYLSDPAGKRQWVVTVPLDSARVAIDARPEGS
jgi:glucose/arabinose dehydrogenase